MFLDLHRLALVFLFAMGLACVHVYKATVWLMAASSQQQHGSSSIVPRHHKSSPFRSSSSSSTKLSSTVVLQRRRHHHHQPNAAAATAAASPNQMSNTMQTTQRLLTQQQQQQQRQPSEVGETIRLVTSPPAEESGEKKQQEKQQQLKGGPTSNFLKSNNNQQNHKQPLTATCTCADTVCRFCHRGLIQVHKMGVTLLNTVMWKYFPHARRKATSRYDIAEVANHPILGARLQRKFVPLAADQHPNQTTTAAAVGVMDYRHVVVTRDFYTSIASGYLYHAAGMECHLDWFGKPGFKGWLWHNQQEDWEQRLFKERQQQQEKNANNNKTKNSLSWPAGRGRDLCTYLAQESERDGLAVYMAWAKAIYLDPLLHFVTTRWALEEEHSKSQQKQSSKKKKRTLFLCFDEFVTNYTATVQRVGQWLVPNANHPPIQVQPNDGTTDRDVRDLQQQQSQSNKPPNANATVLQQPQQPQQHATSRDPVLRARLHQLIGELDEYYFAGAIAAGNAQLGC